MQNKHKFALGVAKMQYMSHLQMGVVGDGINEQSHSNTGSIGITIIVITLETFWSHTSTSFLFLVIYLDQLKAASQRNIYAWNLMQMGHLRTFKNYYFK